MHSPRPTGEFEQWPYARVFWAVTVCLLAVQIAAFHGVRSDDAYITYRYGQNLANGLGLVFNPGQRVQGSTSPGHMLISALVYSLVGLTHTPSVMAAIGCIGWCAQAVAVCRLLTPAFGPVSAAAIGLGVGLGAAGAAGFVPLETHLVAACALFGCTFARERRWTAAAISCGAAVVMRPDAGLIAVLLMAVCCWELRAAALRPVGTLLALVLPWPLFAAFYYGSPLPQTAVAKFQRVGLLEYFVHELSYPALRMSSPDASTWWVLLVLVMAAGGAIRLVRVDRRLWPLVVYGLLHAAAYLVLRPFKQHTWHLYPWTLVFSICVLASVAPRPGAGRFRVEQWLRSALLLGVLAATALRFADDCRHLEMTYWTGQRDAVYRRIAGYLRNAAPPGTWFTSVEVGTIAYYTQLPAYDLGGLVTREDDPVGKHAVRFVVVDKAYQQSKAPAPPVFSAQEGTFRAVVYRPGRR